MDKKGQIEIYGVLVIIAIALGIAFMIAAIPKVGPQQAGVLYNKRSGEPIGKYHGGLINPLTQKVGKMYIGASVLSIDNTLVGTKDGRESGINMKVTFVPRENEYLSLWRKTGGNYGQLMLESTAESTLKGITIEYDTPQDLVKNRPKIEGEFQDRLDNSIFGQYFLIADLSIQNIQFPEEYQRRLVELQNSVMDKEIAIQKSQFETEDKERVILAAEKEKEKQRIEAQTAAAVALIGVENEATVLKKRAQGEADAVKIRAEADAAVIGAARDMKLLEYDFQLRKAFYEKWDGEIPLQIGGDSTVAYADLTEILMANLAKGQG